MTIATETTISSKGQVTIPQQIRTELGLRPGQKIWVGLGDNREVVLKPMTADVSDLFGMLKADHHVSVEDMSVESSPQDDLGSSRATNQF